ncbi:hypothetical protein [Kingella oralis]|uniref:hypothetical protein n=1 Tax=Kingella oralis TaxID=505 RepID=UPI0028E9A507|nr:hypothetical protein [Kingella oralis]
MGRWQVSGCFCWFVTGSLKKVAAWWLALGVALTMRFLPAGRLFFASPKWENLHSPSARLLFPLLNTSAALPSQVNRTALHSYSPNKHL